MLIPLFLSCSTNNSNDSNGILFSYQSYVDISNQYTIYQFKKIPFKDENLNLGFFKGAVFIKIKLNNTTSEKKTIVIYNNDKLNRNYSFYRLDTLKNKLIYQKEGKEIRYRDGRSFDSNTPNFKITLNAKEKRNFYLYTTSDGRVFKGHLFIISLKSYVKRLKYETIKNVTFYGFIIVILLINFFYWEIFKKRIYTFYILYIVFTFFINFGLDGYLFGYGIDNIIDYLIFIFIRLMILMLVLALFTSSFLNIKETYPKFYIFLKRYSISILIFTTGYQIFFLKTPIGSLRFVENMIVIQWLFFILILIILSIEKKWIETTFYLLGLFGFVLFVFLGIIYYNTLILSKSRMDYNSFFKMGTIIEFIIFTYTTTSLFKKNNADIKQLKIDFVRKEKEHKLHKQSLEETNTKLQSKLTEISNGKIEKIDFLAIFKLLESNLTNENEWHDFKNQFQELNPCFLTNLCKKHPSLSKTEIRLLTLVKIGFTQKEISGILFIASDSVKKAKQRARKKMNICSSITLSQYLTSF